MHKIIRFLLPLGLSLSLVACAEKGDDESDEERSSESKKKASDKSKRSKTKGKGKTSNAVASPKATDRAPFATGQWTRHAVTDPKQGKGHVTYAIIGKEGKAHWLDFSYEVGARKMSFQALVDFAGGKDFRKATILKAKAKTPAGTHTISGAMLAPMKDRFADALGGGAPTLAGLPQEDMTVPAGTFLSCYRSHNKQQVFGVTAESTVWHHPAVPITTMVKMKTKDGSEWVLTGYGMTGAKATM
ncbi:MAG: hypothetical protein JRI68_32035 [Deltaproteobacteria bacterium]|nr:hypothetical protein [Deltaproteobacteria bacterium]